MQRCVRCGFPFFQESSGLGMVKGHPVGSLVDVSKRGGHQEVINLDARHGGSPPARRLCRLQTKRVRHSLG